MRNGQKLQIFLQGAKKGTAETNMVHTLVDTSNQITKNSNLGPSCATPNFVSITNGLV